MNEPDPVAFISGYQSLMSPVLRAAEHGEVRIGDIVEKLASRLGLDEAARSALLVSGLYCA